MYLFLIRAFKKIYTCDDATKFKLEEHMEVTELCHWMEPES